MRATTVLLLSLLITGLTGKLAAQAKRSRPDAEHIVFLVGESEYGSWDTMPAFAKRLERDHAYRVTLLQSKRGDRQLPDLSELENADLLVMFLRFREATPQQFATLKRWFDAGKPAVALRTTSHAFWGKKGWFPPFFGGHYKSHAPNGQGTKGIVVPSAVDHPIMRDVPGVFDYGHGGTYNAQPLADTTRVLMLGKTGVLPAEPIAWTNEYRTGSRLFYTSLGSRENFERPAFRTLLDNAVRWALAEDSTKSISDAATAAVPAPPARILSPHATQLFSGDDAKAWQHYDPSVEPRAIGIDGRADTSSGGVVHTDARWQIKGGALIARPGYGDALTREGYGNYLLHTDVFVPVEPGHVKGAFRGNSGIFLDGRYEIQIADSHGRSQDVWSFGAIAGQHAPLVDAALPAGQWQRLDIAYRHFENEAPVVSVWLNGKQVQREVELKKPTVYGFRNAERNAKAKEGTGIHPVYTADRDLRIGREAGTILARFRASGDGTIFSRSAPKGKWSQNAKAVFIRGGRIVYDIGWVGMIQGGPRVDDGKWHTVGLVYRDGNAELYVDGRSVATKAGFNSPDDPKHVFKIGAASTNFARELEGYVEQLRVLPIALPKESLKQLGKKRIDDGSKAELAWRNPAAPAPVKTTKKKAVKDGDVILGPIRLQADSSQVRFANISIEPLPSIDHRARAKKVSKAVLGRGEAIFKSMCVVCHGTKDAPGSLPTALRFWTGEFKNGSDPYSLFQTLKLGYGQMLPQIALTDSQKYDVIHYLREAVLKPHNPSQYTKVNRAYIKKLPLGLKRRKKAPDAPRFPRDVYKRMDFGPSLNWTYQLDKNNIAYKGIAVRLEAGDDADYSGGLSKAEAWIVYDHDTMRVAGAWSGSFVDWRGIAFDGSHGTHTSISGDALFVNPVGPGVLRPGDGSSEDPRFLGKDGKPYGPLPRTWTHYKGLYKHGHRVAIEYTIGDVKVVETPSRQMIGDDLVLTRTMHVAATSRDVVLRLAPESVSVALSTKTSARIENQAGERRLVIPAGSPAQVIAVHLAGVEAGVLAGFAAKAEAAADPRDLKTPGPRRWDELTTTEIQSDAGRSWKGARKDQAAYVIDDLTTPYENPWSSWMRLGGFDFYPDGKRAAVCTWMGDVWIVSGLDEGSTLTWQRIASGLFQPLGVKIIEGQIFVTCRDQLVRLHDLNGDEEIDWFESFNNDHQVTEHFHEFAMGLQADAEGNFYYAKSARHAKTALVPHHGTLLRIAKDGSKTDIVANGFRAANGVCINPDGSFFVTDQEGHWTPKNRINRVVEGGYYGNYYGYHDRSDKDSDMEPPMVWLTNRFDRSPAELLWVDSDRWGPLQGRLLQVSYGMGKIFVLPHEQLGDVWQGGQVPMPLPVFPTGIMRGRFSPADGQLYSCGMFAWAGNRQDPGGFYRIRYTGEELIIPVGMSAKAGAVELEFSTELDSETVQKVSAYTVRVWDLKRTKNYGSKHHNERELKVTRASLISGRVLRLEIPDLGPTRGMKIRYRVKSAKGKVIEDEVHNTIHQLRDK